MRLSPAVPPRCRYTQSVTQVTRPRMPSPHRDKEKKTRARTYTRTHARKHTHIHREREPCTHTHLITALLYNDIRTSTQFRQGRARARQGRAQDDSRDLLASVRGCLSRSIPHRVVLRATTALDTRLRLHIERAQLNDREAAHSGPPTRST